MRTELAHQIIQKYDRLPGYEERVHYDIQALGPTTIGAGGEYLSFRKFDVSGNIKDRFDMDLDGESLDKLVDFLQEQAERKTGAPVTTEAQVHSFWYGRSESKAYQDAELARWLSRGYVIDSVLQFDEESAVLILVRGGVRHD